jgi:hypothetical protein
VGYSFVICNGIPKSGSTLLMVYTEMILKYSQQKSGQSEFQNWIKNGPVGGVENFAFNEWPKYYNQLIDIAKTNGSFVIKTHLAKCFIEDAIIVNNKTLFSIRDPRDIILSLLDHSKRSQKNGKNAFKDIDDFEKALSLVKALCTNALIWIRNPSVEVFRYEKLITETRAEVKRIAYFLDINDDYIVDKVIHEEKENREFGKNQFNKGNICRFIEEMSTYEIEKCNYELKNVILDLGYKI